MRFLQLNLNHCEAAQDLIEQTVRESRTDVAILSEPYRCLNRAQWEADRTGKAAIWTCGKCNFEERMEKSETGFVRAKVNGVHVYSCYAPPSLKIEEFEDFLDRLVRDVRGRSPVVIGGDFNAWAVDWGSLRTDRKGQAVLEALSSLDLVLLNSGTSPTFSRGAASSIVDLTFISSCLARDSANWKVTDICTLSDHRAIMWDVRCKQKRRGPTPKKSNATGWKVDMFEEDVFRLAMEDATIEEGNATEKMESLMAKVTDACDVTMPRKRENNHHPPVYWWNDTIVTLRGEYHKARRKSQRARGKSTHAALEEKYKEASSKLTKAIKNSKKQCWNELLSIVDDDPWGRPYKVVMQRLKTQPMSTPTDPQVLRNIVSTLFPQQQEHDYHIEEVEGETIPPITAEELAKAARKIKSRKAPGLDGIPNVAIKTAIREVPEVFTDLYNRCLKEGTFPKKWKKQRLVLIRKPEKLTDDPSSFRPLCMLDTGGKVLERIVHNRIEAAVEDALADNQYGFRKSRSTLDAVNLVVNTAKNATSGARWKRGAKKYCLVATLDIKNAFNSARWDCIWDALNRLSVPQYLKRIVMNYLSDRILIYDTEEGPQEYKVTGGVPQGSVLGPLLWNIMYDGLLKLTIPDGAKLVAFADDVAVVITAKHLEEVNSIFEETLVQIQRWMSSVGLKLAEHKTEAVLITSRKIRETITLSVGEHTITSQPYIRYLGVLIDARLSFKQHVEHASNKAANVAVALSRLMPNVGGPRQKRRTLLASVITSVMTYAIAIWSEAMKIEEYRKKAAAVCRLSALRVSCAFRTVSEDAACVIAGMAPIEVLAEERRALYQQGRLPLASQRNLRTQERQSSTERWQMKWNTSSKGRWTFRLIPQLDRWVNRRHGEVNYYLTQLISGHGCFRAYLHKYKHEDSPECPTCRGEEEDAEHVFFRCPRFSAPRREVEDALNSQVTPENLIEEMLASPTGWEAVSSFAAEVLKELRREERARNTI